MTGDGDLVLIAGGGPVGLLCAWLLGRRGLRVRLFDNNAEPQADPRAATTHPATLELLAEDGLAADMARVGLVAPIFQFWDRPSGELVAQFDHALLKDDTRYPYVVQCEQFKTAKLILDRLRTLPHVEVLYGHEIVDVSPSDGSVTVDVRGPERRQIPYRRFSHRRRWRAQHRAQAVRDCLRRLHLAGAIHRASRRRMISRPSAAIATAAISPTRAPGAIVSRCPPTVRPACGALSFQSFPNNRKARS